MNWARFCRSGSRQARQLLEIVAEMAIPLPISEDPVQYDD
jgi:hypothetical protein